MAGVPTTAGSRAVGETARPAETDAACLAGARAAGARITGKANLYELAYGTSGINEWFGTPRNPLDSRLLPGGSSSGSAVAVGTGESEIAYGSDTGGSIRIPSAFCGTAGLKTTHGRIPLEGVWPLAPSLDTVGPMARDVAGLVVGMRLLEPGFAPGASPAGRVARLRVPEAGTDPDIDAAVDQALRASGLEVDEVVVPDWRQAWEATGVLLDREAVTVNRGLLADPARRARLGEAVARRLEAAARVTDSQVRSAATFARAWKDHLGALFQRHQVLALPTVSVFPPPLGSRGWPPFTYLTNPFNLAGVPALALPVPSGSRLPASLQLVGPLGSEELLLPTGALIEASVA